VSIALVLPSAGSGRRLDAGRPKALVEVAGVPIIRRTIERFASLAGLVELVGVAPPGAVLEFNEALVGLELRGCEIRVVAGGESRQDSVRAGLAALTKDAEIVCVHDAARPLVGKETIDAVIEAARLSGAATAASRPADSVREDDGEGLTRPLDRERLWLVETPQAFAAELLRQAHARARATGLQATDDASLVDSCGHPVVIVDSAGGNIKVTRPEDLDLVEAILAKEP
jgi:2-C-methyl-D-erythritol 4-phosphate cytidylyltransferase